jgi:uncharacterized protein DUF4157
MSYRSRLYHHRNSQSPETENKKPFFAKQHESNDAKKKNAFFQAKLSVNEPGDQYEHEADSAANAVVNNRSAKPVVKQKQISSVQRLATSMEDEKLGTNDARMERDKEDKVKSVQRAMANPEKEKDKMIHKKDDPKKEEDKMKGVQKMSAGPEKDKDKMVQKMGTPEKEKDKGIQKMVAPEKDKDKMVHKKDDPKKEEDKMKGSAAVQKKPDVGTTASPHVSSRIESSAGKGSALPPKTMNEMSSSFGADFSNVRVHNDNEAANLNKELNAQAFTHGSDIYFNEGKFNPQNPEGKHLLAHELTHVVQQSGKQALVSRSEIADDSVADNACRMVSEASCPGSQTNYTRLGYTDTMRVRNVGDTVLYIHSVDGAGNVIPDAFPLLPGETKIYSPAAGASDTLMACGIDGSGTARLEHPYYCA